MRYTIAPNEINIGREGDGYESLLSCINSSLHIAVGEEEPLFTTDASGLYELFLSKLPAEARQHYNCNTCRSFVNHYGGLVKIDDHGVMQSVMWNDAPPFFAEAVKAIRDRVNKAHVTGVFVSDSEMLGTPQTGDWTHMSAYTPAKAINRTVLKNAHQVSAEKAEDFRMLRSAVVKYGLDTAQSAVDLLRSEELYRSEKVLGIAEWFLDIKNSVKNNKLMNNILWKKVVTAPAGFCHISSSMIGTLLDDIEAGMDFNAIQRRFSEKMNPLQYQRPQAAPAVGNVMQAEKIVERLGIANSLKRRYARLEELQLIWKPRPDKQSPVSTGVFAGIAVKGKSVEPRQQFDLPSVDITWEKFRRTVLPIARKIEFCVPTSRSNFGALVTAEDPTAPPIVKWDNENARNPFTWYVFAEGSYPNQWGISAGYTEVTGITEKPNMWQTGYEYAVKGVFFILDGCKPVFKTHACLFPEFLRSELHEIRATIESYSRANSISGANEASACGLLYTPGSTSGKLKFRVTTDSGKRVYQIDRWD